jgi:tRNA A-37 threonylcarbamoyl transferase component Bud32
LFSKELSECIDLINYFDELRKKPPTQQFNEKKCIFQSIARAMVKMHSAGIYHKDLHLKNVLIQKVDSDTPAIYIIDFDKAVIKGALAPRDKVKNLLRFNRSIEKYKLKWKTITSTDQATLLNEYFKYDPEVTDIFNKYKKRYNILLRLRKLKWHLVSSILKN